MYEKVEFEERTSVDGYIMLFAKNMNWVSVSREPDLTEKITEFFLEIFLLPQLDSFI